MPSMNKKIIIIKKKSRSKKIKIIKKAQQDINNNDTNYINDKFLMNESQIATSKMLELGMPLDSITKFIKTYQEYYLKFDKMDSTISKSFTFEVFYKKCCKSL